MMLKVDTTHPEGLDFTDILARKKRLTHIDGARNWVLRVMQDSKIHRTVPKPHAKSSELLRAKQKGGREPKNMRGRTAFRV